MDKPLVQSKARKTAPVAARTAKPPRADGASTRQQILEAARRCLCDQGYANLNVRDIARDAGVNHALIGYHFHGKQQLVLAVLDEANQELLARQTRMYGDTSSAEVKWQQACDFYDQDLKSGFVRLLMELMAASFHDAELRREFVPRALAWHELVGVAVADFLRSANLDLPVSPRVIGAWISWFWTGMEVGETLGITDAQGHQREALEAVGTLLRLALARVAQAPTQSTAAKAPARTPKKPQKARGSK
jgi:AcrR family transcriptional regulator